MQGYLEKQTSGVLFRKFQLRYFLQQRSQLVYYNRREDISDLSDPKHIDLSHCIAVGLTEGDNSAREFWIEVPERTYWFRALNTADRDCWIANLFPFNGASALDAFPISRHVYLALMEVMTTLIGEAGDVEGLFRIPGDKHIIDRTCDAIYRCRATETLTANDITAYDLSSVLKRLLRELPESLLTQEFILPFTSTSATAESIRDLVEKLPMQNRDILMKLAVLLHRQIQKTAITKASIKSLSILLGPCLSTNPEAPFLDVNKLISIFVEQGSIVFGYSFSRAIAQQVNQRDSLNASMAKHDPWVNQELEKEVIVTITAEPHLTEIQPIDDIGIEAESFPSDRSEQQDEATASNRSCDESPLATAEKLILTPTESNRNATIPIPIPIQSQFQAQEFGLSSGSELTPRDDDQLDDDLPIPFMDAPWNANSFTPQTPTERVRALPKGKHPAAAQRRNILTMGNINVAESSDSQTSSASVRMRKLSIPQGRSRILQKTVLRNSENIAVSDATQVSEPTNQSATSTRVYAATTAAEDIVDDRIQPLSHNESREQIIRPGQGSSATVSIQNVSSGPLTPLPVPETSIPAIVNTAVKNKSRENERQCEDTSSQPDEKAPVPSHFQSSTSTGIDSKFHKTNCTVVQPSLATGLDTPSSIVRAQSGNPLKDRIPECGSPTPAIEQDVLPISGLTSASSNLQENVYGALSYSRGHASESKHEIIPNTLSSRPDGRHDDSLHGLSQGISTCEKKLKPALKAYAGESTNSDRCPSRDKRRTMTSSTQTAQVPATDISTQTRKPKLDPDMKEMLETAQRQILDYKERLSHYQKKCKSLQQAMESQTQSTALLQEHNIALQAKNRNLFKEQDSINSDLEKALLQLEQARQQIKMQTAINAHLTAALSQQKLQHEAIVVSLENQNQAAIAQCANPVVASQITARVAEVSENSENVNIMLKKRLDMMRSRVQSRLHNSRENLASIESRAIMGLTESKQRIQRLQMELKGLQS